MHALFRFVSFVLFFKSVQRLLPNLAAHSYVPSHPDGDRTEINNTEIHSTLTAKLLKTNLQLWTFRAVRAVRKNFTGKTNEEINFLYALTWLT